MRILVFGDSITQGFHDEVAGGWCNRLVSEIMRRTVESNYEYDKCIVNLGISGDTSSDLLKRIRAEIESRTLRYPTNTYDVALIAIGVNDTQYDMETKETKLSLLETKSNVEKLIEVCQSFKLKIVFLGPALVYEPRIQSMAWKLTHGYSNNLIKERGELIQQIAIASNCEYIDATNVYHGSEEAVLPDGIHPNAAGHEMIYQLIKGRLEELEII
jgi:lysophospholipase L1-like esterase